MTIKNNKFVRMAPILIGITLLVWSGFFVYRRWQATHQAHTPETINKIADTTVTNSTDTPDETPINDSPPYTVAADMPRQIIIPAIRTKGYIQKVGLDQNNAIAVPSNINLAGWYTSSVKPGDKGLSIIDGHVSGRYADAIFKKLGKLKKTDTFQVEFGDKSLRTFEVVEVKSVSVADAAKELLIQDPNISSQLNLITCGGKFNASTQQYDQRVIVYAKLADI